MADAKTRLLHYFQKKVIALEDSDHDEVTEKLDCVPGKLFSREEVIRAVTPSQVMYRQLSMLCLHMNWWQVFRVLSLRSSLTWLFGGLATLTCAI